MRVTVTIDRPNDAAPARFTCEGPRTREEWQAFAERLAIFYLQELYRQCWGEEAPPILPRVSTPQ